MSDAVRLELTRDEALVLFEFLARFGDSELLALQDQAEERTLQNLQCLLEKQLVEIFDADYEVLVESARERLRDPVE